MPSFTKFLDVLPDLTHKIGSAGQEDASGTAGLGFSGVQFTSEQTRMRDKTIYGKLLSRKQIKARWLIDIKYNPMTRAEFDPVNNFLMEKRGTLKPFYISLPQYSIPNQSLFSTHVQGSTVDVSTDANTYAAGVTSVEITDSAWSGNSYTTTGLPDFGDLFTFTDSNDTLHVKSYIITHVETFNLHQTGNQPITGNIRIHFTPGLQKSLAISIPLVFDTPLIQVVQREDIHEYNLRNDNLFLFSLTLEEALY